MYGFRGRNARTHVSATRHVRRYSRAIN